MRLLIGFKKCWHLAVASIEVVCVRSQTCDWIEISVCSTNNSMSIDNLACVIQQCFNIFIYFRYINLVFPCQAGHLPCCSCLPCRGAPGRYCAGRSRLSPSWTPCTKLHFIYGICLFVFFNVIPGKKLHPSHLVNNILKPNQTNHLNSPKDACSAFFLITFPKNAMSPN